MLEELERRNYSEGTTRLYLRYVERFAQHFGKSPDKLGPDDLRTYQAYLLKVRKLDPGTVECHVSALRFLFIRTLHRHEFRQFLPYPKVRRKLPKILSLEEVTRLIDAGSDLFERTLLMALYGTGMRRSELARLKIADIDSQRMVLHVVNGKGGKDRDLPLSPKLLETLRTYWRWLQPQTWVSLANESRLRATDHRQDRVAHLLGSGQEGRHPEQSNAPFGSPQLGNPFARSRNRSAHHPASAWS